MIRSFLEPLLWERFPSLPFAFQKQNAPFVILDAPCPEIGRLEVWDDGDEVTVCLTKISHGHFGCYDEDATLEAKERSIALDVVDFLTALFADRVVLFRVVGGLASGWYRLKEGQKLPAPSIFKRQYVWSRAIPPRSER